ncbi:cytochrome P450 [Xylariales sp. AK1849]|nr:cytochrome P450 [Xylariales sp. AK1849]
MALSVTTVALALTCLAIYNVFFHPLKKYPGPFLWRATKIPKQLTWLTGTFGNRCVQLHEQYGPVIRIAPNELSYIKAQAWKDIFGRPGKREMVKDQQLFGGKQAGAWNLVTAPYEDHTRMRRLFTHAFSNTALVAQEPLLVLYADKMVTRMGQVMERDGRIDIVDFFNFTTFDIMAELAFGEPLGLLENADYIPWVRIIFDGLKYIVFRAVLLDIPVLGPALNWLTASTLKKKSEEHLMFASNLVDKRLSYSDHNKPDLWSFVLKHNDDGKGLAPNEMHSNAAMFMVAGTETTATNLSGLVYHLCRNPRVYEKLVNEIRTVFRTSDEISVGPLGEMQYLNAVLREGLRIYIPGGGGMTRIVPPEGAEICGEYVTGGTYVTMNHYPAYLSSSNFASPKEFIPERWINTDDPPFTSDKREVHEPFSYGPRNCLGKNLAWLELRLLLTKTLWQYDIELLPESMGWTNQKSYLTWEKGPLLVKLRKVGR